MAISTRMIYRSQSSAASRPHIADHATARSVDGDPAFQWQNGGVAEAQVVYRSAISGFALQFDRIEEFTAAAGVTIDEVLLKDGGGTFAGPVIATDDENSIAANGSREVSAAQATAVTKTFTVSGREAFLIAVMYSSSTAAAFGDTNGGLYTLGVAGNTSSAGYVELVAGRKSTVNDGTISITASGSDIIVTKTAGAGANPGTLHIVIMAAQLPFTAVS